MRCSVKHTNPLDDDTPWTFMGSRFETPDIIKDSMKQLMRDWINSLPDDDLTKILAQSLPMAPGWEL